MIYTLEWIEKEATEIAGQWNGDESGLQEDRAQAAKELLEKLDEVKALIEELEL